MKKSIFIFVMLLPLFSYGQDFKFYWKDRWDSHEPGLFYFDKLDHLAANAFGVWALKKVGMESIKTRFYVVTGLSVAYEIRDGFRWRKTGGFSFHDIAAGIAGQAIVFGAEKIFTRKKNSDKALRQEVFFMADSIPATFSQRKLR